MQHYVIKLVSDLRQHVADFLWVLRFPPPIKLTCREITKIVESGVKHQNHQNASRECVMYYGVFSRVLLCLL